MLPLTLLQAALNQPILIELKSNVTYNGTLQSIDNYMNLFLADVIQTSHDGLVFTQLKEVYIRGPQIKYLRIAESVLQQVKQQSAELENSNKSKYNNTAPVRGRGRGRGGNSSSSSSMRGGAQVNTHQSSEQQNVPQRGRGGSSNSRGGRGGSSYQPRGGNSNNSNSTPQQQ